MLIRRTPRVQARMPSMRPPTLTARQPMAPISPGSQRELVPSRATDLPTGPPQPATDDDVQGEKAAGAGGFHESSYELQSGLQVSESAWPDDVTVPGKLGAR
jgi:hypothetical protein